MYVSKSLSIAIISNWLQDIYLVKYTYLIQ